MVDNNWKQSAVMVYVAGSVLTILCLTGCILHSLFKNEDRRQRVKKVFCFFCINDPMVGYDTVRNDDAEGSPFIPPEENMFSIGDDEIDVPLNGALEMAPV